MVRNQLGCSMLKTYMTILFMLVVFVLLFVINNTTKFLEFQEVKNKIMTEFMNSISTANNTYLDPTVSSANKTGTSFLTAIREASTSKPIPSTKSPTTPKPTPKQARQDSCDNCFKHDFNLVINSDAICKLEPGRNIDLLVLISTEHSHLVKRNAIRNSWMQIAKNNTSNVRYAFTLGEVKNEQLQKAVLEESQQYKDILKEDFVDAYNNLTLKTLMGMKWATLHCPDAKYVMKTDDDMWVNINGLLKLLEKRGEELKTVIGGSCAQVAGPIRDHRSKWYASKLSYPHDRYPGFCSGTGYVTSSEVAKKIYEISPSVPFFHLEDVYMAICIRKLGLKLKGLPGFHPYRPRLPWCKYKADGIITIHQVPPKDLLTAWNTKC